MWSVYVDKAHSWTWTFQGYENFYEGRERVEVHPYGGWVEVTSNPELLDKVCDILAEDCWFNVQSEGK